MVVKLKIFKVFSIDSALMKWLLFGIFLALLGQILLDLLKIWPEVVSNKENTVFEKCFEILNFGSNGTYLKFTVFVHFDVEFTAGKPKILLKTKTSASNASLGIINRISPRSQKNSRILQGVNWSQSWSKNSKN